ncbi:hypothetical protein [Streptomyces sp. NBC_01304]|uniref:hypothetical protein n=1 Tax=Streptomyces sp. NBC_01304 TaxID=2903818 RepID=UPI002E1263EB|nr:hypothetical protein OG430_06340 [Streptomyces sp. NBC_01304]
MISYTELFHLDVAAIKGAADQWDEYRRRYERMDEAYDQQVLTPFDQAGWSSFDATSVFARAQVADANKEFTDAGIEAKGLRAVLEDAYDELKGYQADLRQLTEDGKKNGVLISATGQVSLKDPDKDGDGGGGLLPSGDELTLKLWEGRIQLLLVAATNADQSAVTALRRNTGKLDEGFNDKTVKSVDQDESERASTLLKKYEKGEKLSPSELDELHRLMVHNQKDPEFSRMTIDSLGPEGTLRLAEDLEKERTGDGANKDKYGNIQSALANNLATANKDKQFSEQWRKDMAELGTERTGDDGRNPYGYQTLASLLKQGDTGSYPPHMTTGLTDDIIEAEKKHPGLWDEHDQANAGADVDPVAVKDPVDDMLKVMSGDPDTATRYLDPGADGGNKRLEYLLDKRDWPDLEVREVYRGMEPTGQTDHIEATNSRTGLGSVLENAVTGDKAGPPHTDGQARIMRDTIDLLDTSPGNEGIPANLQKPMGNALADYTNDTHQILTGVKGDYREEVPGMEGSKAGADGVFGSADDSHISPDPQKLIRLMRGASDDPEAYATMHKAETAYIAQQMDAADGNTADAIKRPAREGGSVLGTYDAIRDDVIYDKRDSANAQEDWNAKIAYHAVGAPVTAIPVLGDTAQRLVDCWTYDMSNQYKDENNDAAAAEAAEKSMRSERQMDLLVEEWAELEGPGRDHASIDTLQEDLKNNRNTRRELANDALGR